MKRTVVAALLASLVVTGCSDNKPVAPAPQVTTQPPTAEPTTAEPTTAAPTTPAALPVPYYPRLKACITARCTLLVARNGVQTDLGTLRVEVVAQPATADFGVERPTYLSLWNAAGHLVYVSGRILATYVAADPKHPTDGLQTDKAGRVFVPFAQGAHSSFLVVLDANALPVKTFNSVPGNEGVGMFGTDTPGVAALDVDGDGINEIDVPVNDYTPNYAEGTTVERYFSYKAGVWVLLGCTKLSQTQPAYQGPKTASGDTDCKP